MGQRRQRPALRREERPDEAGGVGPRRDLADPRPTDAGQDQGGRVRVRDLLDASGDQSQGVILLGARQQQRRELLGYGHPALAVPGLPVQSGVLHGDGRGLGEREDDGRVPVVETVILVAQVQAPVDPPARPQGGRQDRARGLPLDPAREGGGARQVVVDDDAVAGRADGVSARQHGVELVGRGRRPRRGQGRGAGGSEHVDGAPGRSGDRAGGVHQTTQRVGHGEGSGQPQGRAEELHGAAVQADAVVRALARGGQPIGVDRIGEGADARGIVGARTAGQRQDQVVVRHAGEDGGIGLRIRVCHHSRLTCAPARGTIGRTRPERSAGSASPGARRWPADRARERRGPGSRRRRPGRSVDG